MELSGGRRWSVHIESSLTSSSTKSPSVIAAHRRSDTISTLVRHQRVRKPLKANCIADRQDLKEGFALHCAKLLATY